MGNFIHSITIMNYILATGLFVLVCAILVNADGERSTTQCADRMNGTPCSYDCRAPDCRRARCCNGFCRRGRVFRRRCGRNVGNARSCHGQLDGTHCARGGCCQGQCMHGSQYRAVMANWMEPTVLVAAAARASVCMDPNTELSANKKSKLRVHSHSSASAASRGVGTLYP